MLLLAQSGFFFISRGFVYMTEAVKERMSLCGHWQQATLFRPCTVSSLLLLLPGKMYRLRYIKQYIYFEIVLNEHILVTQQL